MQSDGFLDEDLYYNIKGLSKCVKQTRNWTKYRLQDMRNNAFVLLKDSMEAYSESTGRVLSTDCLDIVSGVFDGDYNAFVQHFNCIIFLRKLIYRLDYYEKHGVFPIHV